MAPRSRTGCLTCRGRKLKCDEARPICANCLKAHRECVLSQPITFRHQQNPSLNGHDQGSLKSFYGYRESFAKSTTWLPVPPNLTFVHTSNPYDEDEDPIPETSSRRQTVGAALSTATAGPPSIPAYITRGLEALSAVATDQYTYAPPPTVGGQHTSSQHNGLGLDFILNPSSQQVSPVTGDGQGNIDPQLRGPSPVEQSTSPSHALRNSWSSFALAGEQGGLPSFQGPSGHRRRGSIEDPELAYLLRQATEHALSWMDLFDLDLFFAAQVPVLAVNCPLLLYSCASLSAKSLARVNGRRPIMDMVSKQSKLEVWPGQPMDAEKWMRKGREYYDIAVSLLRQSLAGATRPGTSSLPEDASPATILAVQGAPLPTTDSDELVAATAILCVYEFIDASGPEWSRHLDGAKTLFDVAREQAVPPTLPPSPQSIEQPMQPLSTFAGETPQPRLKPQASRVLSSGRKAVFWCFARQDMLSAFINNTCTRLDTADLTMWRSAGLKLTCDGFVMPSHPRYVKHSDDAVMGDDMVSNALTWLLMKLVNFIAAGDEVSTRIPPLGLGTLQRELLHYWEELEAQLDVWHEGLPDGFCPAATRSCPDEAEWEAEKWFSRAMCASTMQWYSFARIQLLHNKPQLSTAKTVTHMLSASTQGTSLPSRHASYQAIIRQSRAYAKDIVAIANGRADEGTRIHSVQPLWTAGLVLGLDENGEVSVACEAWRNTIVQLLRGIEADIGWAAEYRVRGLMALWGMDPDAHED